jgi:hypothetical protein
MREAVRGVTRPHPRLVEVADFAVMSVLMKLLAACGVVKEPIQKRCSTKDKQSRSAPQPRYQRRAQPASAPRSMLQSHSWPPQQWQSVSLRHQLGAPHLAASMPGTSVVAAYQRVRYVTHAFEHFLDGRTP